MSAILETLLLLFFGFTSLLLICVVIIQKGRGGGLASAFGGGSGTATAFGSKTGDVLTWATSVIFGVFLLIAIKQIGIEISSFLLGVNTFFLTLFGYMAYRSQKSGNSLIRVKAKE